MLPFLKMFGPPVTIALVIVVPSDLAMFQQFFGPPGVESFFNVLLKPLHYTLFNIRNLSLSSPN